MKQDCLGARRRYLPRVARAIGTLSLIGLVVRFRTEMMSYLEHKYIHRTTQPSPEADAHREVHLGLWWRRPRPYEITRRAMVLWKQRLWIIRLTLPGDWRNDFIPEYWGSLTMATVIALIPLTVKALLPVRLLRVSQQKWTRLEPCVTELSDCVLRGDPQIRPFRF